MSLSTYVYLFAAILPAIVLLLMIYRQDKIERESTSLLLKLVFGGVLSALVALVLESMGIHVESVTKAQVDDPRQLDILANMLREYGVSYKLPS